MTSHEKSIEIINKYGFNAKKIIEILDRKVSISLIYSKKKKQNGNSFTESDFQKLNEFTKNNT